VLLASSETKFYCLMQQPMLGLEAAPGVFLVRRESGELASGIGGLAVKAWSPAKWMILRSDSLRSRNTVLYRIALATRGETPRDSKGSSCRDSSLHCECSGAGSTMDDTTDNTTAEKLHQIWIQRGQAHILSHLGPLGQLASPLNVSKRRRMVTTPYLPPIYSALTSRGRQSPLNILTI
jgi:hypothetical protein